MSKRVLLLGPPGVGKGTYGQKIAAQLNFEIFTMGDVVREEIRSKSALGKQVAEYANAGKLVPDEIIVNLVRNSKFNRDHIILDGFPRTIAQAKELQNFMPITKVLELQMKDRFLVQKLMGRRLCSNLQCGRNFNIANCEDAGLGVRMPPILPSSGKVDTCDCGSTLVKRKDDEESVIKYRLDVYRKETLPLVQFYKELGILQSFEIRKGLDDYPHILNMFNSKL